MKSRRDGMVVISSRVPTEDEMARIGEMEGFFGMVVNAPKCISSNKDMNLWMDGVVFGAGLKRRNRLMVFNFPESTDMNDAKIQVARYVKEKCKLPVDIEF